MNDSSWGAPQGAGYRGAPEMGAAPAGPAHDVHGAQQTRPMPIVPDLPDEGGDADDRADRNRDASHTGGPLFRDEKPQEPMSTPSPPPPPEKKRAGRDLRSAIGVGVGLGAVVIGSLFVVKAVFVGVIALAVVVGLWELTSRLKERKGIDVPLAPLAAGGAAMVGAGYVWDAEGAWIAMALTALAVLVQRMTRPPADYLRDVTAGVFAVFYVPFLATFVAMMLTADDGAWRVLTFLLLTVVSDTGAYAVGWRFGRHKLAPASAPARPARGCSARWPSPWWPVRCACSS